MTSCPLSLKAIPAHNSSQRDIKHPLKECLQRSPSSEKREGRWKVKEKKRKREKEKGKAIHHSMKRGIDWFAYGRKWKKE
jgi:hypothetical protein